VAFGSSRGVTLAARYGSAHSLDGVGGSSELVRGDVGDGSGLSGRVGRVARCTGEVSCRPHGAATCGTGLHHGDLTAHPAPDGLDRLTRPSVVRLSCLEQREDVFGAGRRPQCEQVMIGIGKRPATTDRYQAGVSDLGKDHLGTSTTGTVAGGLRPAAEWNRKPALALPIARPGVSRHLRVLREAGLVDVRQEAQRRIYSLRPEAMVEVDAWLEDYRVLWRASVEPCTLCSRAPGEGRRPNLPSRFAETPSLRASASGNRTRRCRADW